MKRLFKKSVAFFLVGVILVSSAFAVAAEDTPEPEPCSVTLYTDAECTEPYEDVSLIDPASDVYYKIDCAEGYFCKRMYAGADYADGEKLRFGTQTPAMPELEYCLLGDTDGDGTVAVNDVSELLKYLAGWYFSATPNLMASDINGDQKVNIADVTCLMKYVADWDIDICDGVAENLELYCSLDPAVESRVTWLDKKSTRYYAYIINDAEELERYIALNEELYRMNEEPNENNTYNADELRSLYDEAFFEENDLVIYDFSDSSSADGTVFVERVDDTLKLVIRDDTGYGLAYSNDVRYHKLIPISRDMGIDLSKGIIATSRRTNSIVNVGLYEINDRPVVPELFDLIDNVGE